MSLRFKEANGRHYEDPASDSSWAPGETKDLDSRHGSHIAPGKLKAAVFSGKILDLDDYFQVSTVLSEPERLAKEIAELNGRLQGLANQITLHEDRIEKSGDKRETIDLIEKIKAVKAQQNEVGKAIAEKQAAIAKLKAAPAPVVPPVTPVIPEAPVVAPPVAPAQEMAPPVAPVQEVAPVVPVAAPAPVVPVAPPAQA